MNFINATMALAISILLVFGAPDAAARDGHWTDAFQASPADYEITPEMQTRVGSALTSTVSGTIRFTLYVATGGSAVRVRFSNEDGGQPLRIMAATVALAGDGDATTRGAIHSLTFGGQGAITIPPGSPALSDAVPLDVDAMGRLVVSILSVDSLVLNAMGGAGLVVGPGDQTRAPELEDARRVRGRPLVSGVLVESARDVPVVVALGDSITDGLRDSAASLQGYPQRLAQRFALEPVSRRRSVVNAGIAGNQVLRSGFGDNALSRLDRDVLRIENLTHIILLEGINDIGMGGMSLFGSHPEVTAQDLIAGYRQIIARAHARGVRVIGGTLTPFGGSSYFTSEKEQVRLAVNHWIRTSGAFDAVIDFEAMLRDPENPERLRAAYDSGDHLHPSDAGYRAMGDGIDMQIFR